MVIRVSLYITQVRSQIFPDSSIRAHGIFNATVYAEWGVNFKLKNMETRRMLRRMLIRTLYHT